MDEVTSGGSDVFFAVPITKMEPQEDGSVIVGGICTSDNLDLDDQIIDLAFSRKGLSEWQDQPWGGNVRQMHSMDLPPAGTGLSVDINHPDGVYLTARIIEPTAVKLVRGGAYKAFSVGVSKPRIIRDRVAKNGRVVDGIFSEVSIVDFPANPISRFNLVKRSKTEIKKIEKTLSPIGTIIKRQIDDEEGAPSVAKRMNDKVIEKAEDDSMCSTCGGTGKIKDGTTDCPDCAGKAVTEPEVTKSGDDEADAEVTADLEEADAAIEEAEEAQEEDNEEDEEDDDGDDDEDDDDDDEVTKSIEGVPYALRRAHDAICDAYSASVVASSHPSVVKNGYKAILEPEVIRSLLGTIAKNEDPKTLVALASAVGSAQQLSHLTNDQISKAHDEIHKAFSDGNPGAFPTPGSITPGQFQRSFISTGRAPISSSGSARIPAANSSIIAADFADGGVTEGREATSPETTGVPIASNQTAADQVANVTANSAMNAMTALHDHIAAAYPTLCSLDQGAGFSGGGVETIDTDGGIQSIAASATPDLTKAEKKAAKRVRKIEKARALLAEVDGTTEEETVEKSTTLKTVVTTEGDVLIDTSKLEGIIEGIVEKRVADRVQQYESELNAVKADIEKIGSEPDPGKAPVRGSVMMSRAVEKSMTQADELRTAAQDKLREEVEYVTLLTKSGHPELRMRAEARLEKLMETVQLENLAS